MCRGLSILMLIVCLGVPSYPSLTLESYSLNSLLDTSQKVSSGNAQSGFLTALFAKIRSIADTSVNPDSGLVLENAFDIFEEGEATFLETPLVYPNPIKLSTGGALGYKLSKSVDIKILFYNMRGHKIKELNFAKGADYARGGTNEYFKLPLNLSTFGQELSAGVYFYIIFGDNVKLGKGKFAVKP